MTEQAYTHCLFCSLCCPIKIESDRGERFRLNYETQGPRGATGLCGRGSSWVELVEHPGRLRDGLRKEGGERLPLSGSETGEAFAQLSARALEQGRIALVADGNLPCEDLVTLYDWASAKEGRVAMAVYLPPPDLDLLEGLSAVEAPTLAPEELTSFDGVIVIGNALQTHPVLGRPLLDEKFKNSRAVFAVLDTLPSVTTRFATVVLDIAPEAHQQVLEKLLPALDVTLTVEESPVLAALAQTAGVSYGRVKRLVSQLQAARKVAVVVSAELTKNSDWRSVGMLAGRLARAKGGAVLPLCSYGNAVGAYRLMRHLRLARFEGLLKEGKSKPWAAVVQVACDLSNTYPAELLEPLWGSASRKVMFASLPTPGVSQADLTIAIPLPVEYIGTAVTGSGIERRLKPMERVSPWVQSVGDFFRRQLGRGQAGTEKESLWKTVPSRGKAIPAEAALRPAAEPGDGRARLQAVTGPVHFDDGALTRQAGWTLYWEAAPQVSIGSALAERLAVKEAGRVVLKQNGSCLELACRVDPTLEPGQATVSVHFPEVRRFLPWRLDESGARLCCPAAAVELESRR